MIPLLIARVRDRQWFPIMRDLKSFLLFHCGLHRWEWSAVALGRPRTRDGQRGVRP